MPNLVMSCMSDCTQPCHTLFRSACRLLEGEAEAALADADECIRLTKGEWEKGFLRRASALQALGRFVEEEEALRRVSETCC
jgi:hypothetical protein